MKTGLTKKQKRTSIYFTEADDFVEICTYNTGFKKRLQNLCRQKRSFWHPLDGTLQRKETASCQRAGEKEHTEFEEDGKMKFLSCKSDISGNRVFAVTYSSTNKGG